MITRAIGLAVAGVLLSAIGGMLAVAQTPGGAPTGGYSNPQMPSPAGDGTLQQPSSTWMPNQLPNGVVEPPPGPPPEGAARDIKLPDCAPPNCGVPQIME